MLPPGSVALAMVSGGADSVAVLRLLAAGALGATADVSVLHVNHLLRGADADADAAFVESLCDTLGLACTVDRQDVAAYADETGLNLEDAGRRLRYRFAEGALDVRCAALGVDPAFGRIVVAHTLDDSIETMLMRLTDGAGARALAGIPPTRGRIVRPLIDARRSDVVSYLTGLGQSWRTDVTNADTGRRRAWVRHELLPLFESRNPSFPASAQRMMTVLAEEDALLDAMAGSLARDAVLPGDGEVVFDRTALSAAPRPLVRRVVRSALVAAFPEASRLTFEHVDAIVSATGPGPFARDLPFGLRAEGEYGRLRVRRRGEPTRRVAPGLLGSSATLDLGDGGTLTARIAGPSEIVAERDVAIIDADAVSWPLLVDSPREGDRMRPLGMTGTRSVADMLIDAKVPKRLHAATPVVRDGERIVWVAGVRLAEECRVTASTTRAARIEWERPGHAGPDGA